MVAEARTPVEPGRAYSILITDDDRGSRETLAGLLADRGFQTLQASCGEEAIDIARVELIHLAIFDMHMPRMTGLEALEQVRLLNDLLPAILVTADANEGLMREAFRARVFSVIPKPVSKNVVLYTVVRALVRAYGSPAPKDESKSE